jgi:hypothetical protein
LGRGPGPVGLVIGPGFALVGKLGYSALAPALGVSVEVHILAAQARVLLWVGLIWLALGIWLGFDPATVAWRAALGALVAMWLSGRLLRTLAGVINERMTSEIAERQAAAEQAARAALPPGPPAKPAGAPRPAAAARPAVAARPGAPAAGAARLPGAPVVQSGSARSGAPPASPAPPAPARPSATPPATRPR